MHYAYDNLIKQAVVLATEVTVAKAELGVKLTCENCETRFYDLNKIPGVCPKCGTTNTRPVIFKASRRTGDAVLPKKDEAPAKPKDELVDIDSPSDDTSTDDIIEDTSDLGDDDVDVEVVVTKKDEDL